MPQQAPTRTLLTLPVADRVSGDTLVKQRAVFQALTHTQNAAGECQVKVTLAVSLYAAAGQGYGEPLTGPGFSSYQVELLTDNNTLVDAQTGQILAERNGLGPAAWQEQIDSFEQATMLQGDFFEYLRDQGLPGTIRQMIEQYIQQADQAGKFA